MKHKNNVYDQYDNWMNLLNIKILLFFRRYVYYFIEKDRKIGHTDYTFMKCALYIIIYNCSYFVYRYI